MNISNLSQETIERLIKLAVDSDPKSAALILLENSMPGPAMAGDVGDPYSAERYTLRIALGNIVEAYSKDRIQGIRELRLHTGMSLKKAVDTIDILRGDVNPGRDHYFAYALETYAASSRVVVKSEFSKSLV